MKLQPNQSNESRQQNLINQLTGYWAQDEWCFRYCPINDDTKSYFGKTIYFTCRSPTLQAEMKYACWQKLKRKEWKPKTLWAKAYSIKLIGDWLSTLSPKLTSLTERDLKTLETSLRSYLVNGGFWKGRMQSKLNSNQEFQEYQWSDELNTLRQIYKIVFEFYDDRTEYEKDVWDVRKLGFNGSPAKSSYTINFAQITQDWLLKAAKIYIKYSLPLFSLGECQSRVSTLRHFSNFLQHQYPNVKPSKINRPLILDFIAYLVQAGLKEDGRLCTLVRLRGFLEICAEERWADVPEKRLIVRKDLPKPPKREPRFIPEDVLIQLNANLDGLSERIRRMVLILQEVGMRISELCRMPFECLSQDMQGDFFLTYHQYKMKKDHTVPISREIAAVIQEQQQVVREKYGQHKYLFPSPNLGHKGEATKHQNFSRAINQLAVERNIQDVNGKLWRFQAHQFRHTVGTRMINLGVPQHIIQKYLGHESPEMTSTYAHIHDQTMKEEFAKFKGRIVDVTGRAIQPEEILAEIAEGTEAVSLDEQWLKQNVLAQALPHGICALPIVQKQCPYGANRCLTGADGNGCTHFKTDSRYLDHHKEHLERTNKIVEWAQENSQSRRSQEILKENLPVQKNLQRIVTGLEGGSNETPA
ncbi:tyrosine-type recombinase/integrase [Pantanalinema sp. GBBB05]|uniref:tyrosine-type recombinase/integrase n=1 Tax=Pantanalinema sp. GBBB05 TaxID=2604139 RepID=UPI001DD4012D|nr:tyrosine-type recombinase/integrase [Pantanalinema sp. GBBB05]